MHLEACFDHNDDDAPDDDDDGDDDGCDDDVGGGDAKTRDLKVDLILCTLCSSEILFYTNTFCAPVKYFLYKYFLCSSKTLAAIKYFKTGLFHLRSVGETEQHPLFMFMLYWSITLPSKQKLKHFYRKLTPS